MKDVAHHFHCTFTNSWVLSWALRDLSEMLSVQIR